MTSFPPRHPQRGGLLAIRPPRDAARHTPVRQGGYLMILTRYRAAALVELRDGSAPTTLTGCYNRYAPSAIAALSIAHLVVLDVHDDVAPRLTPPGEELADAIKAATTLPLLSGLAYGQLPSRQWVSVARSLKDRFTYISGII